MTVELLPLQTNTSLYQKAVEWFEDGWKHPNKTYRLEAVYYIKLEGPKPKHYIKNRDYFKEVKSRLGDKAEQYLFHGTQRACHIGDDSNHLTPCHKRECYFCHIVKHSFKLDEAKSSGMFGPGIYTSSVSSKADDYVKNHDHLHSKKRAIFLSNVVVGESEKLKRAKNHKTSPKRGYDSVEAVTKRHGGAVNYPETIVYREDAILPSMVLIYTRKRH